MITGTGLAGRTLLLATEETVQNKVMVAATWQGWLLLRFDWMAVGEPRPVVADAGGARAVGDHWQQQGDKRRREEVNLLNVYDTWCLSTLSLFCG